jgi:hypothetical protein
MISLKKNDKIIIIVAVVIIVLAGVGVAMYQSPQPSKTLSSSTSTNEKSYDITWTLRNGSLTMISEFAGKKAPYQGKVTIPDGNLKTITFNLTWTDDHMTFLKRMGLDTLTLEVTSPNGDTSMETNTSARITGKGSITLSIDVNVIPPVNSVKAVDDQAARALLKKKPYYDDSWTDKDINFNVSVQIGEHRILKRMKDKGNSFDLSVTYQYYEGILKEDKTITTGLDNSNDIPQDPWVNQEIPPYMSMIINTGCGRFV